MPEEPAGQPVDPASREMSQATGAAKLDSHLTAFEYQNGALTPKPLAIVRDCRSVWHPPVCLLRGRAIEQALAGMATNALSGTPHPRVCFARQGQHPNLAVMLKSAGAFWAGFDIVLWSANGAGAGGGRLRPSRTSSGLAKNRWTEMPPCPASWVSIASMWSPLPELEAACNRCACRARRQGADLVAVNPDVDAMTHPYNLHRAEGKTSSVSIIALGASGVVSARAQIAEHSDRVGGLPYQARS